MPFKKMKGGAGRQRTEPAVNGPLTTGRSVILQNTQMASAPLHLAVFHRVTAAQTDPVEYRVYRV